MGEMSFATGTWVFGRVGDRYNLDGYSPGSDILRTIDRMGGIEDLEGVEMIYPGDLEPGVEKLKEAMGEAGLVCCSVGVDLTGDPGWKFGTLSSKDPGIRGRAVELIKETMDAAVALGSERINLWPGEDGHDYSFQVDHTAGWEHFRDCLMEIAGHRPEVKVCLEYKLREPRIRSLVNTAGRSILMCEETAMENVGVTIDVGHSLQAGENMAESVEMLSRYGRLFHLHLNDNYRGWDDDLAVGSVHLVEYLELMYSLRKVGYQGWFSIDVYPYREDPVSVVDESVKYVKALDSLLDRIGVESIQKAMEGNDPVAILSSIREATIGGR